MSNAIIPDRVGMVDEFNLEGGRARLLAPLRGDGAAAPGPSQPAAAQDDMGAGEAVAHNLGGFLRPLHDRVLVRRDSAASETAGGIVIPEVGKEKPLRGTVVAVGPGKKDASGIFHETMVQPGDAVLFSVSVNVPYADIFQDGDLVMMAEADILGILRLPKSP